MTALIFPKWLENKWAKEKQIEDNRARYKQYYEDHQVCPKCGNGCEQTCMGMGNPDQWGELATDRNRAVCAFCHWKGIVDDLVPETKELK